MKILEEQIDRGELRAKTEADMAWLTYPAEGLLPMRLEPHPGYLNVGYVVEGKLSFNTIHGWPYERKIRVLIDISRRVDLTDRYAFSLDPDNVMMDEIEHTYIMHRDILPAESSGTARFLAEYKALVLSVLDTEYTFRDYMADFTGHFCKRNPLMMKITKCKDAEEIMCCLMKEREQYLLKQNNDFIRMPKKRFRWQKLYMYSSACLIIVLLFTTAYLGVKEVPDLLAGKALGEYYLLKDYENCAKAMKRIPAAQMTPVQSYMLANAYIRMEDLSDEQRENILSTLNIKDSDLRAKYWVYTGRHETAQALDTAKRLADPELEMYSYLQMAKDIAEDTKLSGKEKNAQAESVQSEIDRLQNSLEVLEDE